MNYREWMSQMSQIRKKKTEWDEMIVDDAIS